ncbi:rhodanese-like domain-containing protein [Advenella sp. RU8]|uniref:rhodanese-like domain-containing protein n=1 Tax=Advenella sp. RU8 TaxID=3399575 RepID=UPI003AAD9666
MKEIDAKQLKSWIHDEHEIAILDIREHGQYGENHLFFAVSLPYSVLELRAKKLVPNPNTRIVIYGEGSNAGHQTVMAAATALQNLGYRHIHVLQGGIQAWQAAGFSTFAGVNLPSKTFGELAEHACHTPSVSASQLQEMIQFANGNLVILDGRPVPEYRKMNIPGSICCPNGELALRASQIADDPDTTIVINCAGRTRSIIGAQTLINLGLPNKIYALENGTQGWYLSGYELERQANRLYPEHINPSLLPLLKERASNLARRFGLSHVSFEQVLLWLQEADRNTFLCDIRTEQEHQASQLPALIRHTPGGQLVQATDEYIGVRKARIVLADFDQIRAPVVASWLKQLGWEVYLLAETDKLATLPTLPTTLVSLSHARQISAAAAVDFIKQHPQAIVLDARPSMQFRACHLKNSFWVIRPTLMEHAPDHPQACILLLGSEAEKTMLLARDLEDADYQNIQFAVIDEDFFESSGLPLEHDSEQPPDAACIDFLFFVHDRHNGNKEAARKYLEWETNLVSQIDEQERATFRFF